MLWLCGSILIFSSQSSFYVLLNKFRSDLFGACNTLCASTLYASVMMLGYFVFYKQTLTWKDVGALSKTEWIALISSSMLYSFIGPYFFLNALTTVEIPIATILQRLETIYFMGLSFCFAEEHFTNWSIFNAALTCIGVLTALIWKQVFPIGYLFMIISGVAFSGYVKFSVFVVATARLLFATFFFAKKFSPSTLFAKSRCCLFSLLTPALLLHTSHLLRTIQIHPDIEEVLDAH